MKSRWGSTAVVTLGNTIHSLVRFSDVRFQGAATDFFRAGISIKSALDGTRLAFLRMPPRVDAVDELFVAGGGDLFKVNASGTVTQWGIAAPPDGFTAGAGVAGVPNGIYKFHVTFRNSLNGGRSNPNPTAVSVTVVNSQINLANLPISSDPQVNAREIWSTNAGGSVFFRLAIIADNSTTTRIVSAIDSVLESLQLEFDNDVPFDSFDDVAGPFAGRAWWISSAAGQRGNIYYSASGRPEAVEGFVSPTSDDDPMQRVVVWGQNLYGFSESGVYQVIGTGEPFLSPRVPGAPGVSAGRAKTIVPTPFGIAYRAADGVRLFNGVQSALIGFEAVDVLFRGETREDVPAFDGTVATYALNEYIISDTVTTLALNLSDRTWRNLGLVTNALYFEEDTNALTASITTKEIVLETTGVLTDDMVPIAFEVETAAGTTDVAVEGLVQRLYVEVDTGGQILSPTALLDDSEIDLDNLLTSGRQTVEYPLNRMARVVGLRLEGSLTNRVEVFGVEADVYVPDTVRAGTQ